MTTPRSGGSAGFALRLRLRYRALRYRHRLDPGELAWASRFLRPGDTVLDIGAHKGAYTYWFRRAVGERGAVLAFEPQADLADYLRGAVAAFGWRNVDVRWCALSARSGHAILRRPGRDPSPGAVVELLEEGEDAHAGSVRSAPEGTRSRVVPVDTLDRLASAGGLPRPVRLVKCDVEGHELDVFRGGEELLRGDRPALLFECEARHRRGGTVEEVFAWLEALGYRGRFVSGRTFRPLSELGPERRFPGRPTYVNNFVFEPKGSVAAMGPASRPRSG